MDSAIQNQTNILWSIPFELDKNDEIKMSDKFFNVSKLLNSSNLNFFNNDSFHNFVSLIPPARPTIKTTDLSNSHDEFSLAVGNVWDYIKKLMGFSPDCRNDGHKNLRGDCICGTYYRGNYCEEIICLNNGTQHKGVSILNPTTLTDYCKCPHSEYITGKHCEIVKCQNGGTDLGNGHCACVDGWYTGQFCQYYTSSWLLAVGLPLLGVAILIMCCVICRLDLCPKRRTLISERRSRRYHLQQNFPHELSVPIHERNNIMCNQNGEVQSLTHLNQNFPGRERTVIIRDNYPNNLATQSNANNNQFVHFNQRNYLVRLEQIPNYNLRTLFPHPPSQMDDLILQQQLGFKVEPPPSYDQALLTCRSLNPQPPNYSPPNLPNN